MNEFSTSSALWRSLTIRYALALALVAALVTGAFMANAYLVNHQKDMGAIINTAGAQRMLSQRIMHYTRQIAARPSEEGRLELRAAIERMTEGHQWLRSGHAAEIIALTPEIYSRYHAAPDAIDPMVQRFLAAANRILEISAHTRININSDDVRTIEALGSKPLLIALDGAVVAFEAYGEGATQWIVKLEMFIWLFILAVLIAEAVIIFMPLASRARESFDALLEARDELRHSEERFRGAFEAAPHGMGLIDARGRWTSVNTELCALTGHTDDDLLAMDGIDIVHPDDREAGLRHFADLLRQEGSDTAFEIRLLRKSGYAVPALVSMSACRNASGAISDVIVQFVDLSSREQAEARRREAERLGAIGSLAAGLAHEFNNLLAAAMGNAQLIEEAVDGNPRSERRAKKLIRLIERGSVLTRQVLAYARRQALDAQPTDLKSEIDKRIATFNDDVGAPRVRLADGGELPCVSIDRDQFGEALGQLVANAREAEPDAAEVAIRVETVAATPPSGSLGASGRFVAIHVDDTGPGVAINRLDDLTEPFFTTKADRGAAGLGLSMVDGFARQSGGWLKFSPREAGGFRASLYVPEYIAMPRVADERSAA